MAESNPHAPATLVIDLNAIAANYRLLQARAGHAACAAVVKADAYGLGAARVAPALFGAGCRHFFVAHLDEGIALRPHLPPNAQIFVLHGVSIRDAPDCQRHRLIPVLNSTAQIEGWKRLARREQRLLPAIVQVDTGMARLGLAPDEIRRWESDPAFTVGIAIRYLMSHLACAERQDDPMNAEQLARLAAIRKRLPPLPVTFANSSGIFLGSAFHFDLVRPGAALYGVAPVADAPNPMQPVVRLQARIIQTRRVAAGEPVGYGASWRADRPRVIATVAAGYADGWLRASSNRGAAMIGGIEVPQIGRISMDTLTLDVTGVPPELLAPGMPVDLLDAARTVDVAAQAAGTIGYEILTSLGARYRRDYVGAAHADAEAPTQQRTRTADRALSN